MSLEELKKEYDLAKSDVSNVISKTAKAGIYEELRKLNKKIRDEENRVNSKLEVKNINGIEYEIPCGFGYYEEGDQYTYEVKDGCLYRFEKMQYDKDGSFHLYHHVWIPQTDNKYVNLCVRVLGGDIYGERYYLTAHYYKHPADDFSYMEKHVRTDNYNYKPYYLYVIEKMGLKQKKDRRETNLLDWVLDRPI